MVLILGGEKQLCRLTFELNLKGRTGVWKAGKQGKSTADSGTRKHMGKTDNDWVCSSARLSCNGSRVRRGQKPQEHQDAGRRGGEFQRRAVFRVRQRYPDTEKKIPLLLQS